MSQKSQPFTWFAPPDGTTPAAISPFDRVFVPFPAPPPSSFRNGPVATEIYVAEADRPAWEASLEALLHTYQPKTFSFHSLLVRLAEAEWTVAMRQRASHRFEQRFEAQNPELMVWDWPASVQAQLETLAEQIRDAEKTVTRFRRAVAKQEAAQQQRDKQALRYAKAAYRQMAPFDRSGPEPGRPNWHNPTVFSTRTACAAGHALVNFQ